MNTHYADHALYTFDPATYGIVKRPVRYADTDKHPGETPFIPDIEFQQKFLDAFKKALEEIEGKTDYKFVVDADPTGNNKAEGFLNGDLTFIYIRSDKFGFADYRVEFKASLMVPFFYQDQRNGMKNKIVADFLAIDKKRD
jgi:hypothetical protein